MTSNRRISPNMWVTGRSIGVFARIIEILEADEPSPSRADIEMGWVGRRRGPLSVRRQLRESAQSQAVARRNSFMARRKTTQGSILAKKALAERLADLRVELYGEQGGPEMARRLGIPVRTWYNYECGVTVPAVDLLKVMKLTSVEALWLSDGTGPKFRDFRSEGVEGPRDLPADREDLAGSSGRSEATLTSSRRAAQETKPSAVAEILSQATTLKAPEELEELTAALLALRARTFSPVVSGEETRLLLVINEGIPVELTDRIASLIEKRDESGLSLAERSELVQLAEAVERRGVERAEALSNLAEFRGVSLRGLMKSLGVSAGRHG